MEYWTGVKKKKKKKKGIYNIEICEQYDQNTNKWKCYIQKYVLEFLIVHFVFDWIWKENWNTNVFINLKYLYIYWN